MSSPRVPVISAMYFGPVELYRFLAGHKEVVVDVGEHYERQTYRTRTSIIGPNGKQDLVVQIARRSGEKMPMRSVGISYVESWPQQHIHALRSAYGKTPWFIHFIDDLEELLLQPHERLVDLDIASMQLCLKWLAIKIELVISDEYVESPITEDLRSSFQPKKPLPSSITPVEPYQQVFADRHGFVQRLGIIDLLCNCGPQSMNYLLRLIGLEL
ncbi:MAG: WbqC family protein [Bacteroidota bacterium]|nr:WbqC family protein [Bacteroidota bacterium]